MTKKFVIVIILAIVAIVVISVGIKLFNPTLLNNLLPQSKQTSTIKPKPFAKKPSSSSSAQLNNQQKDGKVNLPKVPVNINAPAVRDAKITYAFRTTIQEIKDVLGGKEIVTNMKTGNIPQFIISNQTSVYIIGDNGETQASSVSSLSVNQIVLIVASFDLKNNTWTIERVSIVSAPEGNPQTSL